MDAFAKYYNEFVGADYNRISKFIVDNIKKYKKDSELICDLGCGTGIIAAELANQGYDMIAIDSSEDMLLKAKEHNDTNNIKEILLLCQDITEFELYGTVDVIYSTLDTINYITSKRDLSHLFKLVRNYLNYDGLFIFDVNTEYKFKQLLSDNTYYYDTEDIFCCWSAYFDKTSEICSHELTYFEKNEQGSYNKTQNVQYQRYYSQEYLSSLFDKYGFTVIKATNNYTNQKVNAKTERITYILKINK